MRFRNAFHIAIDNFSTTYKLLLYRFVTWLVSFSLVFVILRLGLDAVVDSARESLRTLLDEFLRVLGAGEAEALQAFFETDVQAAVSDLAALVGANAASITWSIVGVCFIYLVTRFLNGLSIFAAANTLGDRMSVYARTKFSAAFFKNIGKASLYQVIYVPLCFAYDALSVTACWYLFFYAPSFLPAWGLVTMLISISITLTALALLQALKMAFVSAWMPAIVSGGERVTQAMKTSFRSVKGLARRFSSFLIAIYLIAVVNVVFGIVTFGSALFLTIPLSFLLLLCLQFVYYFEDNNKKYFITYRTIAGGDYGPEGIE